MTKSDAYDHNVNLLKATVKLGKRSWIKHNKLSDSDYKSEKITLDDSVVEMYLCSNKKTSVKLEHQWTSGKQCTFPQEKT